MMLAPWRGDLSALRAAVGHQLKAVCVYVLEGQASTQDGSLIEVDQGLDLVFEDCVVSVAWLSPGDVEGIGSLEGPFSARLSDDYAAAAVPELAAVGGQLLQIRVEEHSSETDDTPTALALAFDTGHELHIALGELVAGQPTASATSLICQLRSY